LHPDQKIVLSAGMATRNIGAALAPLFSIAEMDQPAIIMVVLGFTVIPAFCRQDGLAVGPGWIDLISPLT
jgi:hypothetical protein